jgi:WD40 repeat protein
VEFEPTADSTLDESAFEEQPNLPTPKHEFQVYQQRTSSFVFLHDNVHIVSGAGNGTMHKWDCKTGLLVGKPWERKSRGIGVLALSPDGKTIACSGMYDRIIQRWNTDGEIVKGIWTDDSDHVQSLSWSPCGGRLASGSMDGIILIRNAKNEEEDIEVGPIKTNQGWIYALAYSPLGDKIASGGSKETICIWDANTGELLQGPIDDLGSVFSIVWSRDSSKIYSADRFVRVLDSNSGAELHRFEHFNFPCSIALSPKHGLLAAVGHDGAAQLWDTESYQPLGHPFHHEDHQKLTRVSFSQDGRYLAYCGLNYKITLWMVKDIIPNIEVRVSVGRSWRWQAKQQET